MIELMRDIPHNLLGMIASGKVTAADYESVIPEVERF